MGLAGRQAGGVGARWLTGHSSGAQASLGLAGQAA